MRFMMFMIPRVYQPDAPPGEIAGEVFAPPAEAVEKMMKFNEELAKVGALIALDGLHPVSKVTAQATPYLAGMERGWSQSLDRLTEHVANKLRK